jgi:hypothetical protein
MKDKILIFQSPLADFSTSPWGILKVVDGKVTLDVTKAFNRARLMLNSGANMFRILRRGVWSTIVPFDWEDAGYWHNFRDYLTILHMPVQGTWTLGGADVLVEIFDGCSEEKNAAGLQWQYENYPKARQLIQAMFSHLGDLPWVKFGVGNEMNKAESIEFVEKVVYPEFKAASRKPFSYGAVYSDKPGDDWLEKQKGKASLAWNSDDVSFEIFKQVHGVCDKASKNLTDTVSYWVRGSSKHRTIWSVDGVFDGKSDCDYYEDENGKRKTRPSPAQWRSAVKYVLDYALKFETPAGLPRFGFEYLPKAVNKDECSAKGVKAISEEYHTKWGTWPENWGKYPDDYVEPEPPKPPEPEPPIPPTPEPEKSCYEKFIAGRPFWKWQIGKFIQCLF